MYVVDLSGVFQYTVCSRMMAGLSSATNNVEVGVDVEGETIRGEIKTH